MDLPLIQPNSIEEAFKNIPEEVEDFMWSDAYTIIIDALQRTLSLTDEQREQVKLLSYEFLLGLKSMPVILEELVATGMSVELATKVLYLIDTEIVTRAENITEFYTPNEEGEVVALEPKQEATPTPNSSNDVLTTLQNRLKVSSVVAPVTRTADTQEMPIKKEATPSIRSIDPYREKPQ